MKYEITCIKRICYYKKIIVAKNALEAKSKFIKQFVENENILTISEDKTTIDVKRYLDTM